LPVPVPLPGTNHVIHTLAETAAVGSPPSVSSKVTLVEYGMAPLPGDERRQHYFAGAAITFGAAQSDDAMVPNVDSDVAAEPCGVAYTSFNSQVYAAGVVL
jgi:hypothetical protein